MRYSVNDFELVKFFSYTSTIPYTKEIASVRFDSKWLPNVRAEFADFYESLILEAENVTKYMKPSLWNYFNDNKTVFKIRRKFDNKIFYIGRYDWSYRLGTGVHQFEGTQFDFETMTKSDWLTTDYNE